MQIPRVRFRLRTSLLVVALLAVLMGGAKLKQRHDEHLRVAASHAVQVQRCRLDALVYADRAEGSCVTGEWWLTLSAYQNRLATYHAGLEAKYRRAAARPWVAVPPDPPMESPPEDPFLMSLKPKFVNLLDDGQLIDEDNSMSEAK